MKLEGFVGPSYKLDSVNADAQRCVNLFPEIIESNTGKENQVAYLKSREGLEPLLSLGNGPIRLVYSEGFDRSGDQVLNKSVFFVVSGNQIFKAYYNNGWITSLLGTLDTSSGPVNAASSKNLNGTESRYNTVFVDGFNNYLYKSSSITSSDQFGTFVSFGLSPIIGATHVKWVDGYFILNQKYSGQFFVSDFDGVTFDALSFSSAEGDPDNIVGIEANRRELWLFNERSTEVFVNTGNSDFPFERTQGGFLEIGCLSGYSIAKAENAIFFLGRDALGQGSVYVVSGQTPKRISTHAIEEKISKYSNVKNARGFAYKYNGHVFYILNFDEATWCYDLSTGLWHERAFIYFGELTRYRIDSLCFFQELGIFIGGDYENNKVYKLNDRFYYDDTTPLIRKRICPHISSGKKLLKHNWLEIDMETGVGLDGSVFGEDPKVFMKFSNDGGHTWSNERFVNLGKIGEKKKRVKFERLGSSRDRVYDITISDPVPVTLLGAEIDIESGRE